MKKNTEINILIYVVLLVVLVNIPIYKYGWYVQDDYITLEFAKSINLLEASNNIIDWLYNSQNRYQPVRLFLFTLATTSLSEELVILINLGLHFVNAIIAFKFLRVFHVNTNISILATIIFGANATWRMIESPSAMIGGDGLIFCLVFTSIYLFQRIFIKSKLNIKDYFFFVLSLFLYGCAIYSYESTYPLSLLYMLSLFTVANNDFNKKIKSFSILISPYILIALTYLIFFRGVNSGYEGASINLSSDIFYRFFYYSKVLFKFGISPNYSDFKEYFFICLFILFLSHILIKTISDYSRFNIESKDISILIASLVFIFAISLFILNNWQTPKDVMHHHLYVASFAASLFLAKTIIYFSRIFKLNRISKTLLLSIFLILSILSISKTYKDVFKNKGLVKNIRDELISSYDGSKYIVIENYNKHRPKFHPIMSSMDGALLVWLRTPTVQSATDARFVSIDSVNISTPLSYYKDSNILLNVRNTDLQIFTINNQMQLMPVNSMIDNYYLSLNSDGVSNILCQNILDNNKNKLIIKTSGTNALAINLKDQKSFKNKSLIKINNIFQSNLNMSSGQAYINVENANKYTFIDIYNYNFKDDSLFSIESHLISISKRTQQIPFMSSTNNNRIDLLRDVDVFFKNGFYDREFSDNRRWNWSRGQGIISIENRSGKIIKLKLNFLLASPNPGSHSLILNGSSNLQFKFTNIEKEVTTYLIVKPGKNLIEFSSSNLYKNNTDPRVLSFAIANFCIE